MQNPPKSLVFSISVVWTGRAGAFCYCCSGKRLGC